MYRQILVFSDAQGKSITWRLSVKKNIPAPEGLTYTGRVLVRFVGVYGDEMARPRARNGSYLKLQETSGSTYDQPESRTMAYPACAHPVYEGKMGTPKCR